MTILFALQPEPEGELIDSFASPVEMNCAQNGHEGSSIPERKAIARSVSTITVEKEKLKDKTYRNLGIGMGNAATEKPDEYDVFGAHIATELRCIPNQSIARAIKLSLQAYLVDLLIANENKMQVQQLKDVHQQTSIAKVCMHSWHKK